MSPSPLAVGVVVCPLTPPVVAAVALLIVAVVCVLVVDVDCKVVSFCVVRLFSGIKPAN